MKSGIYQIRNKVNNKIYVGSTNNFSSRWKGHLRALRKNQHHTTKLQTSFNKHGEDQFIFEILEECSDNELITREQYYLDTLKPQFNVRKIAESNRGVKRSAEYKQLLRERNIGRARSVESIEKQKLSFKVNGYKKTKEHLEKIRLANLGKKRKPETVEALRQFNIERFKNPEESLKRSVKQKEVMARMSIEWHKQRALKISQTQIKNKAKCIDQ